MDILNDETLPVMAALIGLADADDNVGREALEFLFALSDLGSGKLRAILLRFKADKLLERAAAGSALPLTIRGLHQRLRAVEVHLAAQVGAGV